METHQLRQQFLYFCYSPQLRAMWRLLFAIEQQGSIFTKGKSWHWGDLAGWPASKPWLMQLRQRGSPRASVLGRAILHSHPECSLLLPCPQTFSVTHTLQSPHSFFSSHVFLKEEPNPVLAETGCYYYLQEKQKILILSKARVNNRWGEGKWRPHRSAAIRYSPYKPKAQVLWPLFAGRETERRGGGTVPRGAKSEPTTSSRTSTACAAQGYFKQHFQDVEINQHMNESWGFFHIKRGKGKIFPIPQASDFSHTTLVWLQLQGTKRGPVQSDTDQPGSKLIASSDGAVEERCYHRYWHHPPLRQPKGSAWGRRHF